MVNQKRCNVRRVSGMPASSRAGIRVLARPQRSRRRRRAAPPHAAARAALRHVHAAGRRAARRAGRAPGRRRRGRRGGGREQVAGPHRLPLRPDHLLRVHRHGGQAAALRRGLQHVARLGHRPRRRGRGGGGGAAGRLAARRALQEALLPARALGRVGRRGAGRGLGAAAHVTPQALARRQAPVLARPPHPTLVGCIVNVNRVGLAPPSPPGC